jgi:hypothetical protein
MFISNADKQYLLDQVKALVKDMGHAANEITVLKGKLKAAEGNIFVLKQIVDFNKTPKKPARPKKPKTELQKAKQALYAKRYAEKKRAEKKAQLAQAVA